MNDKSDRKGDGWVVCPVCGKSEIDEGDMTKCPVCGWRADKVQHRYPDTTGENTITLIEAKARYDKYGTISKAKIIAMGGKV